MLAAPIPVATEVSTVAFTRVLEWTGSGDEVAWFLVLRDALRNDRAFDSIWQVRVSALLHTSSKQVVHL